MKNLKTILSLLSIALFTISCSDDNEKPTFKTENPLEAYYTQAGFTISAAENITKNFEFGLVFTPLVKGSIKAITLKLPAENPAVRVTIWDYTKKTILRTETLNVAKAGVQVSEQISELALDKDKKYMITVNSRSWYIKYKPDSS